MIRSNLKRAIGVAASLLLASCVTMPADTGEPDYTGNANWAVREAAPSDKPADVFYIHPTTLISQTEFSMAMDDSATKEWTYRSVAERQLNAFGECCRLFMPYYRQASSLAFRDRDGGGTRAYELAYEDVRRAFRTFIAKNNDGRPFIIAGHSQGTLLGLWLLQREITGTDLQKRLVAAYLPGVGLSHGALPDDIPPCPTPGQTGCVASWNAFLEGRDITVWREAARRYEVPGKSDRIVCINPLTFDAAKPTAGADKSLGMLGTASKDGGPIPPLRPHAVSARCDGPVLRVTLTDGVSADPLPNGSMHMHEIALFWANIRDNALFRAQQWRKENAR